MEHSRQRIGPALILMTVSAVLGWFLDIDPAVADPRVSILYHEPFVMRGEASTVAQDATNGVAEILRFDAFGRYFEVELERTTRLNRETANRDFELFRGRITNTPGSWVRLMRRGERFSGIVQDVSDTYIIEPRANLAAVLVNGGPQNDSVNIIYRLADTLVANGLLSCGTRQSDGPQNGQTAFNKLSAELTATNSLAATGEPPAAQVGAIADLDFFERFGEDSADEIESLFNVVDGIFSEQVGVGIIVEELLIISPEIENPFSNTTVGSELLNELGRWRRINQSHLDLTHLVTDRDLTGDDPVNFIAGLSFFGVPGTAGVCFSQSGAGMSAWFGNVTALIIAHEMGHNFGAPHDGEPPEEPSMENPCESTPASGFLMSTSLNSASSNEFSQCSLREMQKVIDEASCLRTTEPNRAVLPSGGGSNGGGGGAMNWLSLAMLFAAALIRRTRPGLPGQRRIAV